MQRLVKDQRRRQWKFMVAAMNGDRGDSRPHQLGVPRSIRGPAILKASLTSPVFSGRCLVLLTESRLHSPRAGRYVSRKGRR